MVYLRNPNDASRLIDNLVADMEELIENDMNNYLNRRRKKLSSLQEESGPLGVLGMEPLKIEPDKALYSIVMSARHAVKNRLSDNYATITWPETVDAKSGQGLHLEPGQGDKVSITASPIDLVTAPLISIFLEKYWDIMEGDNQERGHSDQYGHENRQRAINEAEEKSAHLHLLRRNFAWPMQQWAKKTRHEISSENTLCYEAFYDAASDALKRITTLDSDSKNSVIMGFGYLRRPDQEKPMKQARDDAVIGLAILESQDARTKRGKSNILSSSYYSSICHKLMSSRDIMGQSAWSEYIAKHGPGDLPMPDEDSIKNLKAALRTSLIRAVAEQTASDLMKQHPYMSREQCELLITRPSTPYNNVNIRKSIRDAVRARTSDDRVRALFNSMVAGYNDGRHVVMSTKNAEDKQSETKLFSDTRKVLYGAIGRMLAILALTQLQEKWAQHVANKGAARAKSSAVTDEASHGNKQGSGGPEDIQPVQRAAQKLSPSNGIDSAISAPGREPQINEEMRNR